MQYFTGQGDDAFVEMLNQSYAHFTPTAEIPNLSMLIDSRRDTFTEGFFWHGWWIQNSYGFALCAVPFLREPFFTLLQNSLDLYWDRIGDGARGGLAPGEDFDGANGLWKLVAPDGCLGDCVTSAGSIAYKQGDGWEHHDWFYEASAAGVVMQAEILLRSRDVTAIQKYLPLMLRCCEFIEKTRDANGLFLVGPGCNLLAPSFGGAAGGEKSYLAGLTITYTAALQKLIELCKLVGEDAVLLEKRLAKNQASLPLLQTEEGYYVKSLEKDGTRHGVYGAEQYGYFECVANVDAIALGVCDQETAEKIYAKIASIEGLRPAHFLPTNYPGLDDTYKNYGGADLGKHGFWCAGDWVNGGCWGTVEGRAVLAYLKLGRFEDAAASVAAAWEWTRNYRMDAPWSQWGVNTHNPWSDRKDQPEVSVMIDNFAIPAGFVRGVFDCEYAADTLTITPHLPKGLKFLAQNVPIYWGEKAIYISVANGSRVTGLTVNGRTLGSYDNNTVCLEFDILDQVSLVCIGMDGQMPAPAVPLEDHRTLAQACADALEQRKNTPFGASNETLRPMTEAKARQIVELYEQVSQIENRTNL